MFKPGYEIKLALAKQMKSQVWLISQMKMRMLITDASELSSVLSGARKGAKAERMIAMANDILGL